MGRRPNPVPPRAPNPIANLRPIRNAPPIARPGVPLGQQPVKKPAIQKPKRLCPNKTCDKPKVEDGICHNCGTVVEESNIVSEIQFGETSSGAAVVQGNYVAEDQGAARSMGPAFARRAGGGENKEQSLRDGKREIQAMGYQMEINETVINEAIQIFKLCSMRNFIQGRKVEIVYAVCLYSACRKEQPCRVMLIDFADRINHNVFKLGRCFKALHKTISFASDGILPVIPEDLIYRFAAKLEFAEKTDKVAQDAIRLVQRMSLDWMTQGRRPSGVCGACLILAARMNNFRRTVTEVVYIVKITTATVQLRLEEFKQTASSAMTIDDFLNTEFLSSRHDPPSFYRQTEEYKKNKKTRKKRKHLELGDDEGGEDEDGQNKRQRTSESESASPGPSQPRSKKPQKKRKHSEPGEDEDGEGVDGQSKRQRTSESTSASPGPSQPPAEVRRDADGFAIPPAPTENNTPSLATPPESQSSGSSSKHDQPEPEIPIDPMLLPRVQKEAGISEDDLVRDYGDAGAIVIDDDEEEEDDDDEGEDSNDEDSINEDDDTSRQSSSDRKGKGKQTIEVSESWAEDERQLVDEINVMISDPNSFEHAAAYAKSVENANHLMSLVPESSISMDVHVGEDEFANDREVMNCLLAHDEQKKRELIWVNDNKDWLRKQQEKIYAKKMAANGPPKATRKRNKKPRIGEGQKEPAASPAEAAIAALKERAWSKKINYNEVSKMFKNHGKDKGPGSGATSRATTAAPSRDGSATPSVAAETANQEVADEDTNPAPTGLFDEFGDNDMEEDEEDYDDPGMGDIDPMNDDPDDNYGYNDDDDGYDYD